MQVGVNRLNAAAAGTQWKGQALLVSHHLPGERVHSDQPQSQVRRRPATNPFCNTRVHKSHQSSMRLLSESFRTRKQRTVVNMLLSRTKTIGQLIGIWDAQSRCASHRSIDRPGRSGHKPALARSRSVCECTCGQQAFVRHPPARPNDMCMGLCARAGENCERRARACAERLQLKITRTGTAVWSAVWQPERHK